MRDLGPKVTPPLLHKGDAAVPALARPVPFCLQGFLLEKETNEEHMRYIMFLAAFGFEGADVNNAVRAINWVRGRIDEH